jgi:hypothetical protein
MAEKEDINAILLVEKIFFDIDKENPNFFLLSL